MGPTWVLSAPGGPMLAPWTLLWGIQLHKVGVYAGNPFWYEGPLTPVMLGCTNHIWRHIQAVIWENETLKWKWGHFDHIFITHFTGSCLPMWSVTKNLLNDDIYISINDLRNRHCNVVIHFSVVLYMSKYNFMSSAAICDASAIDVHQLFIYGICWYHIHKIHRCMFQSQNAT